MGQYCLSFLLFMSAIIDLSAFDTWPQNLEMATKNVDVILKCGTEQKNITWRHHKLGENKKQRSTTWILKMQDHPDTGNYSCWSQKNEFLNFTYVVIHADASKTSGIRCHTDTYINSTLHCTWNIFSQLSTPALVRAKVEGDGFKDYNWVYVKAREPNQRTVTFDLPNVTFCPFEDGHQNITVILEALNSYIYVSNSKLMFFRDIVKPDHPQNVTFQKRGEDYYVTWEYPSSWTKPHSFFPLQFQVQQVHQGTCTDENDSKVSKPVDGETTLKVSPDLKCFRICCKDLYYDSHWSSWTEWTKKRNKDGQAWIQRILTH